MSEKPPSWCRLEVTFHAFFLLHRLILAASWVRIWVFKHLFPWAGTAISMGEGCRGSVLQDEGTDRAVHLPFPQVLLLPISGHQND